MAQDPLVALIASLSSGSSEQARATLRQLKSHLIGHSHRKDAAISLGILRPLLQILDSGASEPVLLDVLTILASLAAAGPQVVTCLLASSAHTRLFDILAQQSSQAIHIAALTALRNIATARLPETDGYPLPELITTQSALLLKELVLSNLSKARQLSLTFSIIEHAACNDTCRSLLLEYGVLDTLAALLVSWSIKDVHLSYQGDIEALPSSPPSSLIALLLDAINAIITGSCYRTQYFMHLPVVGNICVGLNDDHTRHALGNGVLPELLSTPTVVTTAKPMSQNFTLHSFAPTSYLGRAGPEDGDAAHANAVCAWLIAVARTLQGADRIGALQIIGEIEAALHDAKITLSFRPDVQKTAERDRQMAHLAVPLAVHAIEQAWNDAPGPAHDPHCGKMKLLAKSCKALAHLIAPSKELQCNNVTSSGIKVICTALKECFKPIALDKPIWRPMSDIEDPTQKLGSPGLPANVLDIMEARLSLLQAVAALADKDENQNRRKHLVDLHVCPSLIEALKPLNEDSLTPQTRVVDGNKLDVVIAACGAVQNLSRSVALLRTGLMDAGLVKPIFELLSHPDLDVRIAATDGCSNLVLDSSPMRDDLLNLGIVKKLCEHCRSGPPSLILSSMWALKHRLLTTSNEHRINVLDELGAEWLLNAIQGQAFDTQNGVQGGGVALNSANAAGERVDLLNPSSMDVDEPLHERDDDDDDGYYDDDGELQYDEASRTHYHDSSIRSTLYGHGASFDVQKYLSSLKHAEENVTHQARRDDLAIQEQALDCLRNLVGGPDSGPMVDHLFTKVSPQRTLDLLASKLSPSRRTRSGTAVSKPIPELVLAATHVVNHIANGHPCHRDMIIRQRAIMDALVSQLSHPNPAIRLATAWATVSLTWQENQSDSTATRARCAEMRRLGVEAALRKLLLDPELDIRERAKTVLRSFEIM